MSKLSRSVSAAAAIAVACLLSLAIASPASATAPGSVTGTVTLGGAPMANIAVSWIEPASAAFDTVQTAADGTYTLPLPAGTSRYYLAVNAQAPESARVNSTYLAMFFGGKGAEGYAYQALAPHTTRASYTQDASLETGGSVSGSSSNLANAHINLVPVDGDTDPGPYADSSGNFSFSGYTPGIYQLYAPAHGTFAAYHSAPFTLANGDNLEIDPTLSVGGEIEGTISAAIPLTEVNVTVSGGDIIGDAPITTTPDGSGHWTVSGLSNGTYTVTVANSGAPDSVALVAQTFTQHIVLGQTASHDVTLVRAATIEATFPTSSDPNTSFFAELTDSNGKLFAETGRTGGGFEFADVTPGSYTFGAVDDPSTGYATQPVTVGAGQTVNLGTLALSNEPISVSGKVAGGHTGFLRFVQSNSDGTATFLSVAYFDKTGVYRANSLLPGKYDVYIFSSHTQRMHYTTTITASKTANYNLGPAAIPVTGMLELQGSGFAEGSLFYSDPALDELQPSISRGVLSASGQAGTYTLATEHFYSTQADFQENSPFYFIWPSALKTIRLISGHTTNLGVQSLKVGGVG